MKILKQIINAFQLKLKWVRIMIILSIITILILLITPVQKHKKIPVKALREYSMEERADSSIHPVLTREPIEIKIINEEEPFDWKGTITWAIGAANGLILIILNIKNLLKKKS